MAGKKLHILLLLIVLVPFILTHCATSFDKKGKYHRVQGGETLQRIAKYYRVSVQDLAEWNNIENNKGLVKGMKLYLPPRPPKVWNKKLPHIKDAPEVQGEARYSAPVQTFRGKGEYVWPTQGRISSPFGIRNGRRHDGLDIAAPRGTPIVASRSGTVVFSDRLSGYGKVVIVKHPGNYFTTYAHCHKIVTKKGKKVKQGQKIALVGNTGRSTGNHLHFEIRHGQKARNPLFFLPVKKGSQAEKLKKAASKSGGSKTKTVRTPVKKKSTRRSFSKYRK
jgi:murein DD-endopeptidase MepM/ murein hydrolase activator NlpD